MKYYTNELFKIYSVPVLDLLCICCARISGVFGGCLVSGQLFKSMNVYIIYKKTLRNNYEMSPHFH